MSRDYYQDLEITRQANDSDVAKAYRKLSLKWHPKLSNEDPLTANYHFNIISEAFDVLSDSIKKAFYDKYGEEKLKSDFYSDGQLRGGYRFKSNSDEIFENFFGQQNPFAKIFESESDQEFGSLFGYSYGCQNFKGIQKLNNLEVVVECTLNELYNGCFKTVEYGKRILNQDGRTTQNVRESQTVEIIPGVENNQRIIFSQKGHQQQGLNNSDLVFIIKEHPHPLYKRKNNNLVVTVQTNIVNALKSKSVQLETLDGRIINIAMDEIINPQTKKVVKGEGMPIFKKNVQDSNNQRGDLILKFNIKFPQSLDENQKEELKQLLSE